MIRHKHDNAHELTVIYALMTASILTMCPLPETLIPRTTVETSKQRTADSAADTEARQLVASIAHGNEPAFERLYERYHRRLLRWR